MNKKIIIPVIFLLALLAIYAVYCVEETGITGEKTELAVYSEGPFDLSLLIENVKTADYYKGYDNETLAWMETLGDKQVFSGDGFFVVMSSSDARKIPSQYVTDVYIEEFIECDVIENHSLGDVKYPKDVLYIKNVKYLGEEVHDLQGA